MATKAEISFPLEKVDRSNFRKFWLYLLRHWRSVSVVFHNPGNDDIFCEYMGRHGRVIKAGATLEDVFYLGKSYQHAIDKYNKLLDDTANKIVTNPPDESQGTPEDSGDITT